jgi:two-component system, chemotaxis family, sensor kinase CheA
MSGFNVAELMPFYLDETDEHIAASNDALLRLEQDPADLKALQEAFRFFHSIKGSSVIMGFVPVNKLTHHLESLYDQLRSNKRTLDRATLDLTFRCLDELRDYHRDLRARGQSEVDLSGSIARVVDHLAQSQAPPVASVDPSAPSAARPWLDEGAAITVVVTFQANLPLVDMKARLVLNRLSSKARILSTKPPIEQLDETEALSSFTIFLTTEADEAELRSLADVEGVDEIRFGATCASTSTDGGARGRAEPLPREAEAPKPARPLAVQADSDLPRRDQPSEIVSPGQPALMPVLEGAREPAIEPGTPPSGPKPGNRKSKIAETIRVDSDRLDHLMNLAGELVITKARFVAISVGLEKLFKSSNAHTLTSDTHERLESISRGLENLSEPRSSSPGNGVERWSAQLRRLRDNFRSIQDELDIIREAREQLKALSDAIHSLGRVSDGLQKGVLDTRMVPIGPLFERFRRVIRDLSHSSGKEVSLEIDGEKTELDKRMIDELSDPLIHMVRNSVDHGLETPSDREAAGKPRAGTVALLASHRGNSVVITVADDGRGIDCERVRKKVVSKGLLSESEARDLSERDLIAYIWHPGLSTAETITEISGRGVGMDIVKSRIENLNGTVDVRSTLGQGTTFTIRLPLTLAILSSLLVRIYDEVYAISLDHIDEIVEIQTSRIYSVQGRPTIEIRKKMIALVALDDVFHWGGKRHPSARNGAKLASGGREPQTAAALTRTVVIVQNGETTMGLLVDELIGMQEVVLKSLEKNFQAINGLSGASILGDGRVSLILDLDAVIDMVARRPARQR